MSLTIAPGRPRRAISAAISRTTLLPEREVSGTAAKHSLVTSSMIVSTRNRRPLTSTLFGAEPRGTYNRIMLSPVLSGEKTYEEIVTHDADWYRSHGVTTRFGETVTRIDRAAKILHLKTHMYDSGGGASFTRNPSEYARSLTDFCGGRQHHRG